MTRRKRKPIQVPEVDLVIPVYGNLNLLKQCVDSIFETCNDLNFRLMIVDDCSPVDDRQSLYEYYDQIRERANVDVIRLIENSGYPHAVNVGVESGVAKYVIAINSDTVLSEGCIQAMLATLKGEVDIDNSPIDATPDREVGVVGAKLIFPDDAVGTVWNGDSIAGKIQHCGMHMDINRNIQHTHIGWPSDHPTVNTIRRVQFVTGALFGFRRDIWNAIKDLYQSSGDPTAGAMNEVYGRGTYEDIEFCVLARNFGYSVVYNPEAVATHAVGKSHEVSVKNGNGGYDLSRNKSICMARLGDMFVWDNAIATDLPDVTVHNFREL